MSTFDPDALECLAAIVEEGGFERAAQRLSITQSAVSQRLRALEAQVGTVLIVRSRPLKPTSAGQLLLKHTKQMRLLRADLERDLKELAPSSIGGTREEERISIAINADSIATWALPALNELARQGLPMEIIADDQDFTQERLREGQVLGCVTTLKQALRGCKVVPLGAMGYLAVAQAQYAREAQLQAQSRLDLLRAGARPELLAQMRAAVRQTQVAFDDAQRDFERTGRLAGEGAVAGRDLDVASARRDGAAAGLDAARQRLAEVEAGARPEELRGAEAALAQAVALFQGAQASLDLAVAGPRRETLRAAEARVEAARGTVAAAEALLAQTRIVAPSDGKVTLRNAEPGEVVAPGFPIVRIADLARVRVRVYVPEPQIGRVKTGQVAAVSVDAFPGRAFPGVVTEIAEKPEYTPKNVQTREERAKLVFGVKVEVDNPGGELKPGMPADAVIQLK